MDSETEVRNSRKSHDPDLSSGSVDLKHFCLVTGLFWMVCVSEKKDNNNAEIKARLGKNSLRINPG